MHGCSYSRPRRRPRSIAIGPQHAHAHARARGRAAALPPDQIFLRRARKCQLFKFIYKFATSARSQHLIRVDCNDDEATPFASKRGPTNRIQR